MENAPLDAGLLSRLPLFAGLPPEDLAELVRLLKPGSVAPQEPVFWLGDAGTEMFIIREGRVALSYSDESGKETTLAVLGPGDFFGELSLLDGGPRTATARAYSKLELLGLARDDFLAFLGTHPNAAIHMLGVVSRRQRETLARLRGVPNPNQAIDAMAEKAPMWNRIADRIAAMSASQGFVAVHVVWFGFWVIYNFVRPVRGFDPYPYPLLTLIVSLEAIFLSIFVLVSTNRQSEKDRVRADLDYQVNVKAHAEVMQLHQKVDRLESRLGRHEDETASDKGTGRL